MPEVAFAYHATSRDRAEEILRSGLRPGSYLAVREDVANYYLETVEDEGHESVLLRVDLSGTAPSALEPDYPGIEEPLTHTLGVPEGVVWGRWDESEKTVYDCVDLIGSLRVSVSVEPDRIRVAE